MTLSPLVAAGGAGATERRAKCGVGVISAGVNRGPKADALGAALATPATAGRKMCWADAQQAADPKDAPKEVGGCPFLNNVKQA